MSQMFVAPSDLDESHVPTVELAPSAAAVDAPPPALSRAERRQQRRAGLKLPVRLRPADFKDGSFEDVFQTVNACRNSLYIISASSRYYPKMKLRVLFPYNSAHDIAATTEENGEVVRVERISPGQAGIAIVFQNGQAPSVQVIGNARPAGADRLEGEQRSVARQPFSTSALVTEANTGTMLQGRCSDLSLKGCYVDTMNPFPDGADVNVRLGNESNIFEATGRVAASHIGMGMGIVFVQVSNSQGVTLSRWLDSSLEHSGVKAEVGLRAEVRSEVGNAMQAMVTGSGTAAPDRDLVLKLIRMLQSKGILTKAEAAGLFDEPLY